MGYLFNNDALIGKQGNNQQQKNTIMKKFFMTMAIAMMSVCSVNAQSTSLDLAKERMEERKVYTKIMNTKPSKDAKKQAKQLAKEGWTVAVGGRALDKQINESMLMDEVYMHDEIGGTCKRYIQHTAIQTGGTYNAAYASSRNAAITELAGLLRTQVAAAMQSKMDNAQSSSISAVTVDKFNQRQKSIIDATLTNSIPLVAIYRMLPNNNYQVQVRIAFDKEELSARLKRQMQLELEMEGDELNEIVDGVLMGAF